jgi:chromatin assembly factor 1 subunit A
LKKELEKETERGVAENLKLCEKAKRDEEREVLRLAKETAAAVAAEEKQKKKEAARVAKEASLAEAARQKETNKLEREQALVDAKLAKEQALETDKLEKELAKESEKRRLVEVKKANEEALVPELVVFLLKNPRLTSPQVVTQFVDAKVAQDTANKEFVTKVLLRDALREIATPPVNHLDPLRRWGITEIGLTKAGLSEAEADALRVEVPLTSEEKALVTKKEQEAKRNAEKSKLQSQKQKQASVLKGFFSAAPKQKPATEHDKTEVRVAPVSKPLCETRELMFIDAISATNERVGFTYSKEQTLSSWKKLSTRVDSRGIDPGSSSTHVTSLTAGRFGARRGVSGKRTRDALVSSDSSMKTAIERSLADTLAPQRIAKRRKLLSVDCSSEYRDDETVLGESVPLQYRFGFQLGAEQLDSLDQMRKTFPVPGGRPAFWGSGSLSKLKDSLTGTGALSSVSAKALARAPFKRDAAIEYEDELGNFFDSGDEWDEPTEGENLEGSDLEEDDEETAACEKNSDDEALDGFEVPDGYLSEEENGRGAEDELADLEMELETGDEGTHDDERKESVGVTDCTISTDDDQDAFNSRLTQDRSRVTLTQWLERARRQNRPLVISSFAPATPDQRLNDGNNQGGANLLDALRVTRFARAAGNKHMRPLVSMYAPPLTAAEVSDLELLKTSEDKSRRDHDRVRLANEKAAEKTRKDAEKETARCAKELKKAEKERELETKKLDAELKKVERELEKREKQVLKDQRAAEKAAKAQVLAQKTAALLAKGKGQTQLQMTPAKSGTHNKSVSQPGSSKKVSPIKSLFEKAAMAVEAKGRTNSEASIDATAAAPVDTDVFSG